MKNQIISCVVLILSVALFYCCEDMESIHRQYLDGEQIYAGKLDSLYIRSGYKRLMIVGGTKYLGNSCKAVVEIEDRQEIFEITNPKSPFYFIEIDNLEERTHEFKIYTLDSKNNKSVIQTVSGKSLGDIFISSQKNRRIVGYEISKNGTFVNWAHSAENPYAEITRFIYQSPNGKIVKTIENSSTDMLLDDKWVPFSEAEVQSGIITGEKGIDTIFLTSTKITLPELPLLKLDKSLFRLMHLPDDNKGNSYGANPDKYLFDDDGKWYGNDVLGYHSGENSIPLHFTIDLGVEAIVEKMRLDLRDPKNFAGNNPTRIELWGINDLTGAETEKSDPDEFRKKGWNFISDFAIDGANVQFAEVNIPSSNKYRYLRLRVTETVENKGFQLVELTFWATEADY